MLKLWYFSSRVVDDHISQECDIHFMIMALFSWKAVLLGVCGVKLPNWRITAGLLTLSASNQRQNIPCDTTILSSISLLHLTFLSEITHYKRLQNYRLCLKSLLQG